MIGLAVMTYLFSQGSDPDVMLVIGLIIFVIVFANNSAVHSYLILAYSKHEQVSLDVGFYYMANAAGRLVGTILSGWIYQIWGLAACLWSATIFIAMSSLISTGFPNRKQ